MLRRARDRALVAVSATLLPQPHVRAVTAASGLPPRCLPPLLPTASPTTPAAKASPTSSATGASRTPRQLPASLPSAKGWLGDSTFIGDEDRLHLARIDGFQDQAFTELPGEAVRADFSRNGQLAFEHRPLNDAHNVYIAGPISSGTPASR
jgi:hypothetical protein